MSENLQGKMKVVNLMDRRWWQSKKFWIWAISFIGLGIALTWSLEASADWKVSASLTAGMTCVSMTGMLGQAFVDAAVRFAQAWQGVSVVSGHWSEAAQTETK